VPGIVRSLFSGSKNIYDMEQRGGIMRAKKMIPGTYAGDH
jgi:hypothetical protein